MNLQCLVLSAARSCSALRASVVRGSSLVVVRHVVFVLVHLIRHSIACHRTKLLATLVCGMREQQFFVRYAMHKVLHMVHGGTGIDGMNGKKRTTNSMAFAILSLPKNRENTQTQLQRPAKTWTYIATHSSETRNKLKRKWTKTKFC